MPHTVPSNGDKTVSKRNTVASFGASNLSERMFQNRKTNIIIGGNESKEGSKQDITQENWK
jgi:hypothetical protein